MCAILTIAGFMVRGYWMMSGSAWTQHRLTRIAPHVIDTVFLASAIALVFELGSQLLQQDWLQAKIIGLIVYILFGLIALRFGRTQRSRTVAFFAAISVFAYIVGVARSKSVISWLAYIAS